MFSKIEQANFCFQKKFTLKIFENSMTLAIMAPAFIAYPFPLSLVILLQTAKSIVL